MGIYRPLELGAAWLSLYVLVQGAALKTHRFGARPRSRQLDIGMSLDFHIELELELIQSHMAQKPMLRGEVGARALRVRSDVRGHGQVRLCKALGCGRCGCLKPIRACCVVGSAFFLVAPPHGGCAMAPRDSGMCWKQFMMCLEEIQFVAGVHSPPMHDTHSCSPGSESLASPAAKR